MIEIYLAGAIAAFTIDLLVYPLDTLKTRKQSQDYLKTYAATTTKKAPVLRGLYQGIGSVVLATLPAAGLFFSTYESAKKLIGRSMLPEPLVHSSASAIAELASCLILAPAEVIKQNAQMLQKNQDSSVRQKPSTSLRVFRQLSGSGSARRLFTGYSALVARNLPFTALQFPIFEYARGQFWKSRSSDNNNGNPRRSLLEIGLVTSCSAGGAGALAAFITTPSDVVKTRMMLSAGSHGLNDTSAKIHGIEAKKGAWAVTQEVYAQKGVRGLFRGAALRSGWTMLGSGLYLGTYEMAKEWLRQRRPDINDDMGL